MNNAKNALADMKRIADTMKKESSFEFENPSIGTIVFPSGMFGNLEKKNSGGFGIKHIIAGRYLKDGMNKKDIASLLYLIKDTAEKASPSNEDIEKNRKSINLRKNGVWVTIRKNWAETDETWILTGFGINDESGKITKEAQDAIKAVSAQYGYTPEYLSISRQVGACMTSLDSIMGQTLEDVKQKLYASYTGPKRQQSRGGVEF